MKSPKQNVSLKLSPEQRAAIKKLTGKDAAALELTVQELEERIAPSRAPGRFGIDTVPLPE